MADDEHGQVLRMHEDWLKRTESKLDDVLKVLPVLKAQTHSADNCPGVRRLIAEVRFAKGALWTIGLVAIPMLGAVIVLVVDRIMGKE